MKTKSYDVLAFDFDGTLFDTAELNYRAYKLAYFDLGVEIDENMFRKTNGLSVYEFNQAMGVECDVERLRELKAQYYRDYVLYAKPNIYLIKLIRESKLKKILVTTARMCNIQPLLDKYNIFNEFDYIVTQEAVTKHKPDPEAYILAVDAIKADPERCLAFEDSRAGFVAARSAGLDCILVKDFHDDCILDMSGGSDAKTKLTFEEDNLVVRKYTDSQEGIIRLKRQYDYLNSDLADCYVNVYGGSFSTTFGEYCMPYVIGVNFYAYQNKVKMFPEVIKKLIDFNTGTKVWNTIDIRDLCFEKYIKPGVDIYNRFVTFNERQPYPTINPDVNLKDFLIGNYHGDATFENIIIQRDGNIVFIDPVQDNNLVNGLLQDFAKLGQSLYGYEAIKRGEKFDYTIERKIFEQYAMRYLSEMELKSLKFHIACLYFRRLRHQCEQDPKLVKPYGDIAFSLLREFNSGNFLF